MSYAARDQKEAEAEDGDADRRLELPRAVQVRLSVPRNACRDVLAARWRSGATEAALVGKRSALIAVACELTSG
jgi:hypothetical protein